MPIVAASLKKKMETRILNELKAAFASDGAASPDAQKNWESIAKAVAATAEDICNLLLQEAQVAPGIPVATAGSPAAQTGATTSPGKLL